MKKYAITIFRCLLLQPMIMQLKDSFIMMPFQRFDLFATRFFLFFFHLPLFRIFVQMDVPVLDDFAFVVSSVDFQSSNDKKKFGSAGIVW